MGIHRLGRLCQSACLSSRFDGLSPFRSEPWTGFFALVSPESTTRAISQERRRVVEADDVAPLVGPGAPPSAVPSLKAGSER